jgi:uncharacterized protein involved in exopolysaccharide biosynthesis
VEIAEFLAPLRRWWWLLIVGTLCAVVPTYLALRQQPPIYQASTTLMIGNAISNPNPNYNDVFLSEQLANTYADIIQSAPIKKAAMDSLGLSWLPAFSVQAVPNTQLLRITATDTDPRRAQSVANELTRQLILQSPTGANSEAQQRRAFVRSQLDDLEVKVKETQDEITKAQQALAGMFSAREIADTQAQVGALQNKLTTLQGNYAALLSNTQQGAANTLTVVEPAELPTSPAGSS